MQPGSQLINAWRGNVVDIDAPVGRPQSGQQHAAAIDVFSLKPQGNYSAFVLALPLFDNVMLTSHIGASISEAQLTIGRKRRSR